LWDSRLLLGINTHEDRVTLNIYFTYRLEKCHNMRNTAVQR